MHKVMVLPVKTTRASLDAGREGQGPDLENIISIITANLQIISEHTKTTQIGPESANEDQRAGSRYLSGQDAVGQNLTGN